MAVCCQNLPLGALSSRSAPSELVGALFKKFGLFLNTGVFLTRFLLTTVKYELNSTDEITLINQMYRTNVISSSLNNFHGI
jgi:hypothetical protein